MSVEQNSFSEANRHMAEALGIKYDVGKCTVMEKPKIAGPLGLCIPTQFDFSHGHHEASGEHPFGVRCWKISGHLYAAAAFEPGENLTTVLLLDKGRWLANPNNEKNFISAMARGHGVRAFGDLDSYIMFWSEALVGAWSRRGSDAWLKLDLEEVV